MNIRSITQTITPLDTVKPAEGRDLRTTVSSEDRDADGRRQQDEPSKDPLNEEEMKKAKEYLANLTGLKSNGLSIEEGKSGEFVAFLIKDQSGQVVRRILEWEFRILFSEKEKKSGHIFDKSA